MKRTCVVSGCVYFLVCTLAKNNLKVCSEVFIDLAYQQLLFKLSLQVAVSYVKMTKEEQFLRTHGD